MDSKNILNLTMAVDKTLDHVPIPKHTYIWENFLKSQDYCYQTPFIYSSVPRFLKEKYNAIVRYEENFINH